MYRPQHFAEERIEVLHELMHNHPLATVVTYSDAGLDANHIPLQLLNTSTPLGALCGHVARGNALFKDNPQGEEIDILAIFHGPQAYISPNWYPTKIQTGKVVPTWNYAVVHAHGKLRFIDEDSWLESHLEDLTQQHEAPFDHPWQVTDAPREFTEKLMQAIVGFEIVITHLEGKWKMSQNQPLENRRGIIDGLGTHAADQASLLATLIDGSSENCG